MTITHSKLMMCSTRPGGSVARNGEFSPLWELLGTDWEEKLWGIPH